MCHERWALHVVIKRKVFSHLYVQFLYNILCTSISDTCLRSRKSISVQNFDKISQSTAEIKLPPV